MKTRYRALLVVLLLVLSIPVVFSFFTIAPAAPEEIACVWPDSEKVKENLYPWADYDEAMTNVQDVGEVPCQQGIAYITVWEFEPYTSVAEDLMVLIWNTEGTFKYMPMPDFTGSEVNLEYGRIRNAAEFYFVNVLPLVTYHQVSIYPDGKVSNGRLAESQVPDDVVRHFRKSPECGWPSELTMYEYFFSTGNPRGIPQENVSNLSISALGSSTHWASLGACDAAFTTINYEATLEMYGSTYHDPYTALYMIQKQPDGTITMSQDPFTDIGGGIHYIVDHEITTNSLGTTFKLVTKYTNGEMHRLINNPDGELWWENKRQYPALIDAASRRKYTTKPEDFVPVSYIEVAWQYPHLDDHLKKDAWNALTARQEFEMSEWYCYFDCEMAVLTVTDFTRDDMPRGDSSEVFAVKVYGQWKLTEFNQLGRLNIAARIVERVGEDISIIECTSLDPNLHQYVVRMTIHPDGSMERSIEDELCPLQMGVSEDQ